MNWPRKWFWNYSFYFTATAVEGAVEVVAGAVVPVVPVAGAVDVVVDEEVEVEVEPELTF